jgi:uncharacterized protein (UPF0248 family)
MLRETDKHFLVSMFVATGIILFWKGVWEGPGYLPILENPWVDLFIGALILTVSGMLFSSEYDPLGGIERGTLKMLHSVHHHPKRHEFLIKYFDSIKKKVMNLEAKHIKHIEKNVIVVHKEGKESFIPIHRVRSVHRKGETIWKL